MIRAFLLLAFLVPFTASAQDTVRFTPKVAQPTFVFHVWLTFKR